ncbi:MAG: WxL domain-containing protein [Lachnospiraceae bacterium]|nr:WxL domain-containing protein [Lachnospiraceae bacterium]
MSKKKLLLTLSLVAAMVFGSAFAVMAAPADQQANSTGTITFETPTILPTEPTPIDPTDPTRITLPTDHTTVTGTNLLALEIIPNFNFGTHDVTTTNRRFNAIPPADQPYFVQLRDLRGTGAGWNLSAELASQFTGVSGAATGQVLTGAQIDLTNIGAFSNQDDIITAAPTHLNSLARLDVNSGQINLASAAVGQGMGNTRVRFGENNLNGGANNSGTSVVLNVPSGVLFYTGTYNATITWRLQEGPLTTFPAPAAPAQPGQGQPVS